MGAPRYFRGNPIVVSSPHIITGGTVVAPQPKGHRWGDASQLTCEGESQRVPRVSVPKYWLRRGNKHKLVPPPPPPPLKTVGRCSTAWVALQ